MKKAIVHITTEEVYDIVGLRNTAYTNTHLEFHIVPGGIDVKIHSQMLPPEFETPEGEQIRKLSLRTFREKCQSSNALNAALKGEDTSTT